MTGLERDLVADVKRAAEAMHVYLEWIGQNRAKHSGTSRGAPDCLVYVNGRVIPVEFKRAVDRATHTPCGKLSLDQTVAIERRRAQGVETHVVDDVRDFARIVNEARRGRVPC